MKRHHLKLSRSALQKYLQEHEDCLQHNSSPVNAHQCNKIKFSHDKSRLYT